MGLLWQAAVSHALPQTSTNDDPFYWTTEVAALRYSNATYDAGASRYLGNVVVADLP
jgi:hypothetical protein